MSGCVSVFSLDFHLSECVANFSFSGIYSSLLLLYNVDVELFISFDSVRVSYVCPDHFAKFSSFIQSKHNSFLEIHLQGDHCSVGSYLNVSGMHAEQIATPMFCVSLISLTDRYVIQLTLRVDINHYRKQFRKQQFQTCI